MKQKQSLEKLKNGLIDVVIFNLPFKKETEIEVIECQKVQDGFYASKKYIELKDKTINIEELNKYPLIMTSKKSNTRSFIDEYLSKKDIILNPNMELASFGLVKEFTKIGLGIGYLTREFITDELNNNELFEIKTKEKIPNRSIGIAYSKKNLPSFATKELIKMITENKKD